MFGHHFAHRSSQDRLGAAVLYDAVPRVPYRRLSEHDLQTAVDYQRLMARLGDISWGDSMDPAPSIGGLQYNSAASDCSRQGRTSNCIPWGFKVTLNFLLISASPTLLEKRVRWDARSLWAADNAQTDGGECSLAQLSFPQHNAPPLYPMH